MTHDDVLPIIVAALAGDTEQVKASARQLAAQQLKEGNGTAARRLLSAIGDLKHHAAPAGLDSQDNWLAQGTATHAALLGGPQPQCPGCKLDLRGRCQCPAARHPAPEAGLAPLVATAATPATAATKPPAYCPFSNEAGFMCTRSECAPSCDALLGDIGQ